jgi:hypothetical protein
MSHVQFVARIAPRRPTDANQYFIFGATSPLGKYLPIDLMRVLPHRMLRAAYRNSHEVAEGQKQSSAPVPMRPGWLKAAEGGDETAGLGTAPAWPLVTRA